MFLVGFKQTLGLSKSGLSVLELVCLSVQNNPNTDKVEINFYILSKKVDGLTERIYQMGLRELLDREFLYRSPSLMAFFL